MHYYPPFGLQGDSPPIIRQSVANIIDSYSVFSRIGSMRKRSSPVRWLRSLRTKFFRASSPCPTRPIRVEHLESRNLLATILDVDTDITVRVPYSNGSSVFVFDAHDAVLAYDNDNDNF